MLDDHSLTCTGSGWQQPLPPVCVLITLSCTVPPSALYTLHFSAFIVFSCYSPCPFQTACHIYRQIIKKMSNNQWDIATDCQSRALEALTMPRVMEGSCRSSWMAGSGVLKEPAKFLQLAWKHLSILTSTVAMPVGTGIHLDGWMPNNYDVYRSWASYFTCFSILVKAWE